MNGKRLMTGDRIATGNRSHAHEALSLIVLLSLWPMQACGVAGPPNSRSPVPFTSWDKNDLSGVWQGTSVTGCSPLRMTGPWRCGARADIMLTFIRDDAARTMGIYASNRGPAGSAFEETGRIDEVFASISPRLWLRVMMRNHSSCLFNGDMQHEEIAGNYLCFREGSSFERGLWDVRRMY